MNFKTSLDNSFLFLLIVGITINALSLFAPVMDQDSALYACVAKQIVMSGDWKNLIVNGSDWLDKPHLPFWITAFFFKLFGISAFTYKLPAFLCWLSAGYFTFKLAENMYNKATAQLALLVYICSFHGILSNFDVRAEAYLTAFIIAAMYFLYLLYRQNKWKYVFISAVFCSAAIVTKGLFVIITIISGFVLHWIVTKQWNKFVDRKWWILVLLILVFLTPELYCLYTQFDSHPEKIIFGSHHVSGIRFFFWDSQFGRFFNTGPIKGEGSIFFFFHTIVWAYLPWSFVLLLTLIEGCKHFKEIMFRPSIIISGSALITFIIFSVSKFQLPHYVVILFPHFSILCSVWLLQYRSQKDLKRLTLFSWIISVLFLFVILLLIIDFHVELHYLYLLIVICISITFIRFNNLSFEGFIWKGFCFAAVTAVFLRIFIYSELMHYNAGMNAACWENEHLPFAKTILFDCNNYSFEFYSKSSIIRRSILSNDDFSSPNSTILVYCPQKSLYKIDSTQFKYHICKTFEYFRITILTAEFINPQTRQSQTEKYVLITCRQNAKNAT